MTSFRTDWHLIGTAYGVDYNINLRFNGIEEKKIPDDIMKKFMARDKVIDDVVQIVKFTGEKGEQVQLQPRYEGSVFGTNDFEGKTICNLHVNGEFVALAMVDATTGIIEAHEY